MRMPNYIVKTQPCDRRGSVTKSVRVFLKHSTWRITCRPIFTLAFDEQRFFVKKKNRRKVGRLSMAYPERGLWEGRNFKEVPRFLKSNRNLLAFGLTSNKDQTCTNKICFAFFLYRGIYRFCAIFGRFGGHGRVLTAWIRL